MANQGTIGKFSTGGRKPTGKGRSLIGDLFLTKMLKNPNYKTTISLPGSTGVVSGFCEGPFAFQGAADWKPIADLGALEEAVSSAYAGGLALASLGNKNLSNEQLAQLSFKQIRGSEMRYAGSGNPVFQMKLILPSYDARAKQSPIDSVKLLMACVYPEYVDTKFAGAQQQAPLGYGIAGADNQMNDRPSGGTVTISRGRFFRAPNMLIKSVSSTFSQECMEDGYPLYVEANIEFIHWRTPSYETAMSWFGIFNS